MNLGIIIKMYNDIDIHLNIHNIHVSFPRKIYNSIEAGLLAHESSSLEPSRFIAVVTSN